MGKCLSSKVLRTSNNNNFQRQSTDFFNDHFCKFQLSLWHNLELPGRESSRGTLSIMLAVFYIIYSRTGITSPCSNSVPNYWKKNICLRFCLKKQNISDSVWSLLRDSDKDSRKETLYLQSFSGLQDERRLLGPQSMWTFLMPDCLIS